MTDKPIPTMEECLASTIPGHPVNLAWQERQNRIARTQEGKTGANGKSGVRLTMEDGTVWFHPYDGSAPIQERKA